jgi:hypothetical protein
LVGSTLISERLSRSSTKYGPSVSVGVTTHAGVGTAVVDADGDGEEVTADWLRPVHAATTAPATTVRVPSSRRRREINDSRRGAIKT